MSRSGLFRHSGTFAGALALLAGIGVAASAPATASQHMSGTPQSSFAFKTLSNPQNARVNQLLGINNSGTIVGSIAGSTPANGYVLTLHDRIPTITYEDVPGSLRTQVTGINSNGITVGYWVDRNGRTFGFVKQGSKFTTVANPAGPQHNQLLGINAGLKAVGVYSDTVGHSHAYIYDVARKKFTAINISGAVSTAATAINDRGVIVGSSTDKNGVTTGFLIKGKKTTKLEYPGAKATQPLGINQKGQVVGQYTDAHMATHGFIWSAGAFRTVDEPQGVGSTTVSGINASGHIVGFYIDSKGNVDGFLGTSTSVPAKNAPSTKPSAGATSKPSPQAAPTAKPLAHLPVQTSSIALNAQPSGTVKLATNSMGNVEATVAIIGLTPSVTDDPSVHALEVDSPSGAKLANLAILSADGAGRVNATIDSGVASASIPQNAVVVLRLGNPVRVGDGGINPVAAQAIATAPARLDGSVVPLSSVESGGNGPLAGHATFAFDAANKTLTVTIKNATGFVPNSSHAAHIHDGTCVNQGAPKYMLMPDLAADSSGTINATRTITGVTSFTPPVGGWYLNIHQGDSNSIHVNNQPALSFRPLLCGDIPAASAPQSQAANSNGVVLPTPIPQAPRHW